MEWLFMILWPNYVPKAVRDEIQETIDNYFNDPDRKWSWDQLKSEEA